MWPRVATGLQTGEMETDTRYRDLLGIVAQTERDSLAWNLDDLSRGTGIRRLYFLNAHAVNMAVRSPEFRAVLADADTILRDGRGIELAFRYLGLRDTENLNGTDLIPKILARLKGRRIAIWGSSEEALAKLRQRLEAEGFDNLAPMHHGFHEDEFYVAEFARVRPEVVVLCMGMPRQELLSPKLKGDGIDSLIVCGGGWANFHSGHIKRAPMLMQRMKIEFLHRLAKEPRRLGRRYTVDVLAFFRTLRRIKALGRVPGSPDH